MGITEDQAQKAADDIIEESQKKNDPWDHGGNWVKAMLEASKLSKTREDLEKAWDEFDNAMEQHSKDLDEIEAGRWK